MAQLNDLLVLGKSVLLGSIKSNADHDLLSHSNEFTFASPGHNTSIYINYRTSGGTDGAITQYRFCNGDGAGTLAPVYASTFYGALSGNASSATMLTSSAGSSTLPIYFSGGKPVTCSTTLGVSITGNAATATLARKVENSYDRDDSNYKDMIIFHKADGTTIQQYIGGHNVGNTNGAIIINPAYDTSKNRWDADQGFYIGKTALKWNGNTHAVNSAPTLAWGSTSTIGTIFGTALTVKMPANPNVDTKVTNTASNTTKFYITGTSSSSTNTGTQYFDTGIYSTTTSGQLSAGTLISRNSLYGGTNIYLRSGESGTYGRFRVTKAGTAGDGTNEGTIGETYLYIGNSTPVSSAADTGADNARGRILLYGTSSGYTTIICGTNNTSNYTMYLPGASGQFVYHTNDTAIGGTTQPVYIAASGKATACTAYSGLLTAFSSSSNTLSLTVGGTTKTTTAVNSVSNTWANGTASAGPSLSTTVNGITGTAVRIPVATNAVCGATKVWKADDCTAYTDDTYALTCAAVQKSFNYFGWGLRTRGTQFSDASITNLNTKIDRGNYYANNSAGAQAISNGPTTSSGYRLIEQEGYNGTSSGYGRRFAFGSGENFYYQAETATRGSWNEWRQIIHTGNFTTHLNGTYVNVTGDTMTGDLLCKKVESAIKTSIADGTNIVGLHSSTNRGLYDFTSSHWLIYKRVSDDTVRVPKALYMDAAAYITGRLTMSDQIYTSFKSSVATGSYQATATTIPDLLTELRYSSGCMGSVSIGTAYTNGVTIAAGWYNFLYIPHRSGGVNGSASGDNCNYGTLLLMGMTVDNACYRIRYASSAISEVVRISDSNSYDDIADSRYLKKSGDSLNDSKQLTRKGSSSSWYNGRDHAMIRQTTISGYSPIMSIKSTNGSWEMGCYDNSSYLDRLIIGYKDDTEYTAGTPNSIVQAFNLTKAGYLYLASGFSSGGNSVINNGTLTFTHSTVANQKITTSAGEMHYASASTIYVDSGSESSLIFRPQGTEKARFNTSGEFLIKTTTYAYNMLPATTNTYALGNSSYAWGTAYVGNAYTYNIYPRSDVTYNLGSTSYRWNTMYGHQLYLCGTTNATMTASSTNPRITFAEGTGTQPVHLIYTDFNDYRSPAGLKVIGGTDATPAWFEVEGDAYAASFKGPHNGNILGVTETNPSSASRYSPLFISTGNSASVSTTAYTRRTNCDFQIYMLQGTADTAGYVYLELGNSTASGTAGNKYGALRLYSASSGYMNLRATATTSSYTHYLPAVGGTLLNTKYIVGTSGTNYGTEAQRNALSPVTGQMFFQLV